MAPLIAALAKAGLPLLASLVIEKGKDFAEEKLGVDIEELVGTEEGKIRLKEIEMSQEQQIREFLLRQAQQELDAFKEEVKDKDSARIRDAQFLKSGTRNYRADILVLIAASSVAALVFLVWDTPEINEYVKGIVTLVLGRMLGYLDNIYNFEFGTTRGSKQKDATIEHLSGGRK